MQVLYKRQLCEEEDIGGFVKKWDHTGESVLRRLHQRLAIYEALLWGGVLRTQYSQRSTFQKHKNTFFFFNATQMAIPNNNYDDFLKKILGLTLDYKLAHYQEKILIETQPWSMAPHKPAAKIRQLFVHVGFGTWLLNRDNFVPGWAPGTGNWTGVLVWSSGK